MLCEVATLSALPVAGAWGPVLSFFVSWFVMTVIAVGLMALMSSALFRWLYWRPTFETWRWKTVPAYPTPEMVRREMLQTLKGVVTASFCPALSLALLQQGIGQGYCGVGEYGWGWLLASFVVVWVGSDLYEWAYHRLGHTWAFAWRQHKHHHVFFNPSPFSVIADDFSDQLLRSAPLLFFPLLMPVNVDLLYFTFAAFFYAYGAYLHQGHELPWPDAHHPWLNTAFQHTLHHWKSTLHKPMHTGFFVKWWDRAAGSLYPDLGTERCLCVRCCVGRGERTPEAWEKVQRPDYGALLRPSFWWSGA